MPKVFIGSTQKDLEAHRAAAIEACQRLQVVPIAMEDFGPDGRAPLEVCLAKVEQADFYLGIFAHRYGWIPEGQDRSITELEYEHAIARGLPVHLYVVDDECPWPPKWIDDGANKAKLADFKARIGRRHTLRKFTDADSLKEDLLVYLPEALRALPAAPSSVPARRAPIPPAPALHAVPRYIGSRRFVGRREDLLALDEWAQSDATVMVVDGIGGQGKSALTWEWLTTRAAAALPRRAGTLWWSFYEGGATMGSWAREALAYVTGQAREDVARRERGEVFEELLRELVARPFLLVFDGFERVLNAYHGHDASKLRDEEVDARQRACTSPTDTDLLRRLLACAPTKLLVSTRLMPIALENAAHQPLPGVRRRPLPGLSAADAVDLMHEAGVRGQAQAMREYVEQFECHALLLGIVCGVIRDYRPAPGDFDRWHADPAAGGSLRLSDLPLTERRSHILKQALEGLDEPQRVLLGRIALFSEAVDYEAVAAISPYAEAPQPLAGEARVTAQRQLDHALGVLDDRGLLNWDRDGNAYDLHPVVRACASERIDGQERVATYDRIRDHFERLPPEDLDEATELADMPHTLTILRALIGAGRFDDAVSFYRGAVSNTIFFSIASYSTAIELLRPLVGASPDAPAKVTARAKRSYLMNDVAGALSSLGRGAEASVWERAKLALDFEANGWGEFATGLRNHASTLARLNQMAASARARELALGLSTAIDDEASATTSTWHLAWTALDSGQLDLAEARLAEFAARPCPPFRLYRTGDVEYLRCWLGYLRGGLNAAELEAALAVARKAKNTVSLGGILVLQARWLLDAGRLSEALDAAEQALAIAQRTGARSALRHGLVARILARQGQADAARTRIESALAMSCDLAIGFRPISDAAETYLDLGDREQARRWGLEAYRFAWADGPPHIWAWELERARAVLAAVGEPEPRLPPFDPSKVEPLPFEAEVRALIDKLNDERGDS